jgi:hypothetical protein
MSNGTTGNLFINSSIFCKMSSGVTMTIGLLPLKSIFINYEYNNYKLIWC